MRKVFGIKALGLAVSMVALVGAVAFASGATGAYFSDTKAGAVAGDLGSIKVTTGGGAAGVGDGLSFTWNDMLPGELYTASATYQNTGDSVQDVWLVFNNPTALSALNSLGTYGAARVQSSGGAYFYSNNLNDHPVDQGDVCRMLPAKIKLASNVGPTASGSMTFTFQFASKLAGPNVIGGVPFNTYPVIKTSNQGSGGYPTNDGALKGYDQYFVEPGVSGTGLPFQIVATQPGIEPGAVGTSSGF